MKPKICWDTSVFLAYLNQEAAHLADINLVLDRIEKGTYELLVSVMTYTEVLRARHTAKQVKAFDGFLLRSNVTKVDATFQIAQKAEIIRSSGYDSPKKGQKLSIKTVDAQIIATAIVHGADVLHSMEIQHRNLSGSKIVDGLKITRPCLLTGHRGLPGT